MIIVNNNTVINSNNVNIDKTNADMANNKPVRSVEHTAGVEHTAERWKTLTFENLPEEIQEMIVLYHYKRGTINTEELLGYAKTCKLWMTLIYNHLSRLHPVYDHLLNKHTKLSNRMNINHEFIDRPRLIDLSRRLVNHRARCNDHRHYHHHQHCHPRPNLNRKDKDESSSLEDYHLETVRCYDNFMSSWTISTKTHKEVWRCSWTPFAHWNFAHCNYLVNNRTHYYHHHLLMFTADFKHIEYGYTVDCIFVNRILDTSIIRLTRPILKIVIWLNDRTKLTVRNEFVKIALFTKTQRTHDIDICKHHCFGPTVITVDDYPDDLSEIQVSNRYRIDKDKTNKFLCETNRQRYNSFVNMRTYVYFQRRD